MSVKSPEEFFGHEMGSDRKMARWDKIFEYFWQLDELPTVNVRELGKPRRATRSSWLLSPHPRSRELGEDT